VKIAVTGSRYWDDKAAIHSALSAAVGSGADAELYVGDCPTGADRISAAWWSACMGPDTLHVIRARGDRAYHKLARNQLIVDVMPDVVLGHVLYGPGMSRGTYDTLNRAREAGLSLVVQERPAPAELVNIHSTWHS
jgi:hypothetical protein